MVRLLYFLLIALFASCTYTIKIKDGRTAHERKQYATALPMLQKEYSRAKTRREKGELAFLIGDSYKKSGQNDKSSQWFKTAYDYAYGPEALRAYAYSLKQAELYSQAAKAFKELGIEIGSPYEYRKEITSCTVATDWKEEAEKEGWKVLETSFNSSKNDFAPVLFSDDLLVFTSDRSSSVGEEKYNWTGNGYMDLFVVEQDGASPQAFDNQLNTPAHEGTACFSKDFREMYFVRTAASGNSPETSGKYADAYNRIYYSRYEVGEWTKPKALNFQREGLNYMHPALSPDGMRLYYASDDPDGWGGYDLYFSEKKEGIEVAWGAPKSVTRAINTGRNELFPSFDGDTLYFASDGHTGMGGLDVFKTYQLSRNAWAPPRNLKAPVNSGADDFGLVITKHQNGKTEGDLLASGYFSSNREGTSGGDDIFKFEQRVPPPPPPAPIDTVEKPPIVYRMILEGYVLEKIFSESDNPNSKLLARKPLPGSKVQINIGSAKSRTVEVGTDGRFELELKENTNYLFTGEKEGYLNNSERFSTVGMGHDPQNPEQRFEIEIVLDKIYRDREIVLENIYYDYDESYIRPDAEPTLNKLANMLNRNPSIKIQLGSHTDCRGQVTYNRNLSQRRAQAAVDYLIRAGISTERLSAVGYGEAQPAVDCNCSRCTEAEHQANRRTTFRIL